MEKTVKVLVIVFAVMGIGLFGSYWFKQWHSSTMQEHLDKEKEKHLSRIAELEAEIQKLTEEAGMAYQSTPSRADLENVFGKTKAMTPMAPEAVDCDQITRQVVAFFQYLDSKAYLIWPGMDMRAEELFDSVSKQLAASPPINVGEMEDIYNLVRNVTHFYRILGKERIDLIKEILKSESAVIEPAMAVMFSWMTACSDTPTSGLGHPGLKSLYQYACYFLNTLGGRGYLLRRETKLRMLINYYALLTVDMANDAKINSYGIDIRPHLDYLFYDINNQKGLMYRQRYLSRLSALQTKYQ
ncbi:MAG: hypothetical protein PVG41_11060 [Desulfobacteraceae bacterium]|jgi:hypothetical protein